VTDAPADVSDRLVAGSDAPPSVSALVVPLDGSAVALAAAPVASRLARRLGAETHLVSVVATAEEAAAREAELAVLDVRAPGVTRRVVVDPDPPTAILADLARRPGSVACMATHGCGRSPGCAGSVAMAVLARTREPVLLTCPLVEGAIGEGVLACLDGGPHSGPVLAAALRWGELLGEAVTVASVVEPQTAARGAGSPPPSGAAGDRVDAILDTAVRSAQDRGRQIGTLALRDPICPSAGLHRHLRARPAALVVAGLRSRTGLAHLVFGTVAGALVRHSPSPVLIVPAPGAP
jgi:nucleotide-binding universal stress UspA family protein